MMRKTALLTTALALAGALPVLAWSAQIEGARDIGRYRAAAGDEVRTMPVTGIDNLQALDGSSLAVWTAHDKPWLLGVEQPCDGLAKADDVGFTSHDGVLTAGTDFVTFGSMKCKVTSIRPVDYARIEAGNHHRASKHHHEAMKKAAHDEA